MVGGVFCLFICHFLHTQKDTDGNPKIIHFVSCVMHDQHSSVPLCSSLNYSNDDHFYERAREREREREREIEMEREREKQ